MEMVMDGFRFMVLLVIAFCVMGIAGNWTSLLPWFELHPGLASWVQAVGTIAAIYWSAATARAMYERELERAAAEKREVRVASMNTIARLLLEVSANLQVTGPLLLQPVSRALFLKHLPDTMKRIDAIPIFGLPERNLITAISMVRARLQAAEDAVTALDQSKNPRAELDMVIYLFDDTIARIDAISDWLVAMCAGGSGSAELEAVLRDSQSDLEEFLEARKLRQQPGASP
jgi:hypothetical protein